MRLFRRILFRLRALFEPDRVEREMEQELQLHFEQLQGEYLKHGMEREDAHAAAVRAFGNLTQIREQYRDSFRIRLAKDMLQDLRFGTRMLRMNPGFAAASILTLMLGIGATTAIFSVVYNIALRSLPYEDSERLVRLDTRADQLGLARAYVGAANFRDWEQQNTVFEEMALVRNIFSANLTGDAEPERVPGALVTASLFRTLRVQPALGRAFMNEEEETGDRSAVVILSDGLWRRRFGAYRNAIGKTVMINGEPNTVVGVMGPSFHYPGREFQLWKPLVVNPDDYKTRMAFNYLGVARLKPGISIAAARAELNAISRRLSEQYPDSNTGVAAVVSPMFEDTVGGGVRQALYVLLGAVLCLLLTACANLANLLLARAIGRSHELHLRAALGAGAGRLVRQSVAEILPIVFSGGVLGVMLAVWAVNALIPFLPSTMPRVEEIHVNAPVLVFTFFVLALAAVIVGLLPALQVRRNNLASSLQDSSRGSSYGPSRARIRDVIVVGQMAAAVVLVIAAGLLIRSYSELRRIDPGFQANDVLSLHLAIPRSKYPRDTQVAALCGDIIQRVRSLADVVSAGMVNRLPLAGVGQIGGVEGERADGTITPSTPVDWRTVTPEYFKTIGIPLKRGRMFTENDDGQWFDQNDPPEKPLVGIIDEQIANLFWPNADPVGRRFRIAANLPWTEVVGVVGHIRHDRVDEDTRPQVYWNYLQRAQDRAVLVVKTRRAPEEVAASIRAEIHAADPDQPVYDVRTMKDVVDRSISQQWLNAILLAVFAGASLLLTGIGIYGVISYSVGQRLREFGIRMALGAGRRSLFSVVLRQAAVLITTGVGIGLTGAWLLAGILSRLLYNVRPTDWFTYTISTLVLIAIALLAVFLPARRASRIDPVAALK